MRLSVYDVTSDNKKYGYRDALQELKYCGFDVPERKEITKDNIHFYAWLCRMAVSMLKLKDCEIKKLEAQLDQYHKADSFLAVHGWQWKDCGTEHHTEQLQAIKCKHCIETEENEIGEQIAFCELKDRFMNVTYGECVGNCEAEDGEQ